MTKLQPGLPARVANVSAALFTLAVAACERPTVGLSDLGPNAAAPDADAQGLGDDGGSTHVGHPDPGARRFTGRVGTVRPGNLDFEPVDLSSWRITARSELGTSTITLDGLGQFSTRASGRLELSLATDRYEFPLIHVSTTESHVEIAARRYGAARARLRFDVQLLAPWSDGDRLSLEAPAGWSASIPVPASGVGETRLVGLAAEVNDTSHLPGDALWLVRRSRRVTSTSTTYVRTESGWVDGAALDEPQRTVAVELSRAVPIEGTRSWDLRAWQADGWSSPEGVTVEQFFMPANALRSGRRAAASLASCSNVSGHRMVDVSIQTEALAGVLGSVSRAPPGHVRCTSAKRWTWVRAPRRSVGGGAILSGSEICDCREDGPPLRLSLAPVTDLRLDGRPLGPFETQFRLPATMTWAPPRAGGANGYIVELTTDLLPTNLPATLTLVTDRAEVTIPTGLLPEGWPVAVSVSAIADPDLPPVSSPLVRSASHQRAVWNSGDWVPTP